MTRFFRFFVSRHLFANILTIAIILLGLAVLPSINRDTFPSVDLDEVVIVTRYEGASPEDIELKITNKIEDALKRIDGLKKTTSFSVENTSLIQILIEPNADDPKKTKDLIREKIDAINDFPADLIRRPTVTIVDSATFPIMEIGLTSSSLSYPELRAIAKKFKSDLSDLKGISQVDGYGYLNKELKITPNPDRLEQYQVSLSDIVRIISDQNRRASLGTLNQNSKKNTIINDNRLFSENDINNAIVRANFNGQSIRISDLGTVTMGFETPTILSRISGQGGISFNILKSGNADIITVSNKIDALVAKYETQYSNITFIKANDFSMYLKNRLKIMINNGIIGLILVNGVLWFFLNLRTAFWVSLGIPVAVMGVLFLMPPLDMTINIISLLALIIVIGIIVDDGIIVAENIAKFREKGLSPIDASVAGIQSVFKPVLTTILTTIIAFSPMFFMSGVMGKFIFQIPLVITCALLISLVEVVIALPSHLAAERYNRPLGIKKRHQLIKRFRHQYETVLGGFLRNKYIGVIGFLILFFASIFYMTQYMNFVLFPNASATQFFIRTESPAGTSLEETAQRMAPIEQALLRLPKNEVVAITTRVGMMGDAYFMVEQENLGIIMVDLVPFTGRDRSAQEIMEDIKEQTKNTPGFTNISYQVNSGGPPVGKAININIISNNDAQRTAVANAVYNYVGTLPGVISVERSDKKQRRQFQLTIDHDTVAKLGINIQTIHQTVRTAFSGNITSSIRMGNEDINFNVGFSDADKTDVQVLRNILIP
ncbi:MAG: efflux RND transporter permease subunit, partial [Candidatus Marinamargulisbacteria bacterium]